jgi:hypothetical protein
MTKELFDTSSIFFATNSQRGEVTPSILQQYTPDWTMEDALRGKSDKSQIYGVIRSQPVCIAVQTAIVNNLRFSVCQLRRHSMPFLRLNCCGIYDGPRNVSFLALILDTTSLRNGLI